MAPQEIHLTLLRAHADEINAMCKRRWFARPFYEYMSGALVWSDETDASGEMLNALRMLFHCRTQLLMESTRTEWIEYWNAAQNIVPKWVGFHPSRYTSTQKLRTIIKAGENRLEADLAAWECESERNTEQQSHAPKPDLRGFRNGYLVGSGSVMGSVIGHNDGCRNQ